MVVTLVILLLILPVNIYAAGEGLVFPFDDPRVTDIEMHPAPGSPGAQAEAHRGGLGQGTFDGETIDFRFNMLPSFPTDIRITDGGENAFGSKTPTLVFDETSHISPAGSDTTGDGSSGNPYQTIKHVKALESFGSGDTILLHAGTYNEGKIKFTNNPTESSPITIKSSGDGEVIIDSEELYAIQIIEHDNYIFEGITFMNSSPTGGSKYFSLSLETNNTIIRNCKFINRGIRLTLVAARCSI